MTLDVLVLRILRTSVGVSEECNAYMRFTSSQISVYWKGEITLEDVRCVTEDNTGRESLFYRNTFIISFISLVTLFGLSDPASWKLIIMSLTAIQIFTFMGFQPAAARNAIIANFLSDGMESLYDMNDEDVSEACTSYSKHTDAPFPVRLSPILKKRLKSLVLWVKD